MNFLFCLRMNYRKIQVKTQNTISKAFFAFLKMHSGKWMST